MARKLENEPRTHRIALFFCSALLLAPGLAGAQNQSASDGRIYAGRATQYRDLDRASLEQVTTPERIVAVTRRNVAPMEVWRALEHAERVECLSCIPHVSRLLYNDHPRTREIAAWWLRRRILGVFGPGEIYEQTLQTLENPEASEFRRAAAAEALGEFLSARGVTPVARALLLDPAARVRVSAARALGRLNHEGPGGELRTALADENEAVRMAAIGAVLKLNRFGGVAELVERIGDGSARVRLLAVQALGELRARDAVMGLIALTAPDTEDHPGVRSAAAAALGQIRDPEARRALQAARESDPDRFVRNAARIALRRL